MQEYPGDVDVLLAGVRALACVLQAFSPHECELLLARSNCAHTVARALSAHPLAESLQQDGAQLLDLLGAVPAEVLQLGVPSDPAPSVIGVAAPFETHYGPQE